MKDTHLLAFISDIHIGKYDVSDFYNKEFKPMIEDLWKIPYLDGLFLTGDFWDSTFRAGSRQHTLGMMIFDELYELCKSKKAYMRVIRGTNSHDGDQNNLFKLYENKLKYDNNAVSVRVIDTVDEELINGNLKVLYIPEEYMEDKNVFYKEYLNKKDEYDLVVFHGLFEGAIPILKESETERHIQKAPIFTVNDFSKCCKGLIIGGHIHKSMLIDDNIFYIGSLPRSGYGEEEKKGYSIVGYDTITNDFMIKFIENKNARTYRTLKVERAFNSMKVEDMITFIENVKNNIFKCQFIRVDLLPDKDPTCQANMSLLKDYYRYSNNVSIRLIEKKKKIDEIKDSENEGDSEELYDKYKYLFDGTIIEEQFVKFAKDKFNTNITKEDVMRILSE